MVWKVPRPDRIAGMATLSTEVSVLVRLGAISLYVVNLFLIEVFHIVTILPLRVGVRNSLYSDFSITATVFPSEICV